MNSQKKIKNILIVEDELLIAYSIKKMLEPQYNICDLVISYEEAIKIIADKPVDLVLLDINLSGQKTGIDVASYINENYNHLPFIFLTALTNEDILNELLKYKPSAYLSKPLNKANLYSAIHLALIPHKKGDVLNLKIGSKIYKLNFDKILYVESEHVYCNIVYENNKTDLIRISLTKLVEESEPHLLRVNRCTALNTKFIKSENSNKFTLINNQSFVKSKKY